MFVEAGKTPGYESMYAYLNGQVQKYAYRVNTEEGWLDVFQVNGNDQIIQDDHGNPISHRLYGNVEVRVKE